MLTLNYKDGRSLHSQITDGIKELIINGALKAEEKLPSVRELSVALTVNPNTVQRAYRELEAEGFIYSILGKGSFVSKMSDAYDKNRIKTLYKEMESVISELAFMGESKDVIIANIDRIFSKKEDKK